MSLICIVGRGHSGTRMISHLLYASDVFMGRLINRSGDKVAQKKDLYEACRIFAKSVKWNKDFDWDFQALTHSKINPAFKECISRYLKDVLECTQPHKGWKLPETTLIFPWIVRMFSDAKFIYIIRDPRDCILKSQLTDDLRDFGIPYPPTKDIRLKRAISWLYQYNIVQSTPKPQNWIEIRFEDFILNNEKETQRLETFLEMPLGRIIVRKDSIGRYKTDTGNYDFDFLKEPMEKYRYI